MQRTVLQIPLPKELKVSAEKAALDYGFSSLQEILRVIMRKLAEKKLEITVEEKVIYLSKKNERRYMKMTEDYKQGKNVYSAKDFSDFIKQLNAD